MKTTAQCKACGDTALHRLWSSELGLVRVCGQHMIEYEQADLDRQEELLAKWAKTENIKHRCEHKQAHSLGSFLFVTLQEPELRAQALASLLQHLQNTVCSDCKKASDETQP